MRQPDVSPEAASDVEEIWLYGLKNYGLRQTDRYATDLRAAFFFIAEMPLIGRLRTEIRPSIRLLPHRAHNIFYDIAGDAVVIVRVFHHTADWINLL